MKDSPEHENELNPHGLVDATAKFDARRDAVIADEATKTALLSVLPQLVKGETISKTEFARNGVKNAETVLKDAMRVPVFICLGIWSLLAAYINYEKSAFGTFILIGFFLLSAALTVDALGWARLFGEQRKAKEEHLRMLDE